MSKSITFVIVVVWLAVAPSAQAGILSAVFKEGAEYLSERAGRAAARDTAEGVAGQLTREGAETVLRRSAVKVAEESAEQLARRAGVIATRASGKAGQAVLRYGESATGLINHFGDDAAEAMLKLSSRNGRRLIMLEQELAQSGQAQPLLKLVGQKGNTAMEWIWANKGTVAAGVGATVLLTNPDAVLSAGTNVATAALDSAGKNLIRPITEGVVWILTRLALVFGVCGAGIYIVWLNAPTLRKAIWAGIVQGIAYARRIRK